MFVDVVYICVCDRCKCLLTIEHILTKCTVHKQVREKYCQHSQLSHIFINAPKQYTRGIQKVLQLDHKEEWKCYKPHFIFQYNHH